MKGLLCKAPGLPDTLSFEEVTDPQPGRGQVVLQMRAAGSALTLGSSEG